MADFSERSATLRTNERIKHVVGMMTAWGNALIIAAFAQVGLASRFDFNSLMWLVCAAVFFWVSSNILKLLEAEESDG